jgi:hypothetical protein
LPLCLIDELIEPLEVPILMNENEECHPNSHISFYRSSQFSSGALLFITGGLLVASYFISRRVIVGSGQNRSSSSLRGMAALLTGSYGATMVWFLRSYLRTIFFKYAEFALVSTMYELFCDVAAINIFTFRSF